VRALKAFLLGVAAGAVLAYTAAATAALVVSAASGELQLAIGPVELLVVERTGVGTETTFGAGLIGVALVAGVANAAAASVLALRAR
jgi:hypothetical protein